MSRNYRIGRIIFEVVLITAALVFIGIGLKRGEADEIMMKAVKVCLECIGIG